MKKLLILHKAGQQDGCSHYRLNQFARKANELGLLDVQFININLPEDKLAKIIESADAYLLRLSDEMVTKIYPALKKRNTNKKFVVDIDDNYDLVNPLADIYRVYGTQDVFLKESETWLWKNEHNGFYIEDNKKRLKAFHDTLKSVDAVITTTFQLRNYALKDNEAVVVIPNAVETKNFKSFPRDSKETHIIWAGGSTHFADLHSIKVGIKEIMERYPFVHLDMIGMDFKSITKDLPKERTHFHPWISADGHSFRLSCIGGDIGICPLTDEEFNYYKSSIKFYEYSALGIPTVAKNISPYKDDILHGQTGLLYQTTEEFVKCLEILILDRLKAVEIGKNALEYVKRNRELETITRDWAEFFNSI